MSLRRVCAFLARRFSRAAALTLGAALLAVPASAVILDDENQIEVVLKDGTHVRLIGVLESPTGPIPNQPLPDFEAITQELFGDRHGPGKQQGKPKPAAGRTPSIGQMRVIRPLKTANYYYLPTNLRLARNVDGTPQFLLLKFTSEQRADQGGTGGGLLHFLVEWGLTPEQTAELEALLKAKYPQARFMGPVPMEPEGETGSFRIISAALSDQTMAPSVITSGKAPLLPGGKAAVASRLTPTGAQLVAATFEKGRSITDIDVEVNMAYQTVAPAAKGRMVMRWWRLEAERERLEAEYKKEAGDSETDWACIFLCAFWDGGEDDEKASYSYEEMYRRYSFLEKNKVVEVQWQEARDDERLAKIREAFFNYFVQSMTEPAPQEPEEERKLGSNAQPQQKGKQYRFKKDAVYAAIKRGTDVFTLDARFAVRRPWTMTENLASWYDFVRDNPKCIASVNLNDPFFQHRDIRFVLDLDAKEMFDKAVNYVTVHVRKKRTSGNPFEDHVTIDADYVSKHGITAALTYARGEDKDPDAYEYRAQWSLKGGQLYPLNPPWQKGSWEGVTLAPPVVPRTIEVEGSLEDMLSSGVPRITVQVHYSKFGREVEENIHVSPTAGQALVARTIFIDRDAKGYAYRLIVNHKTEGRLALPWSAQVGDDYIYAAIPPELFADGSSLKEKAKKAAEDLAESATQTVLDQFKELLARAGK